MVHCGWIAKSNQFFRMRRILWWTYLPGACGYIYGMHFTATTFVVSGIAPVSGNNTATPLWKTT
jgi:hypothetical protein